MSGDCSGEASDLPIDDSLDFSGIDTAALQNIGSVVLARSIRHVDAFLVNRRIAFGVLPKQSINFRNYNKEESLAN